MSIAAAFLMIAQSASPGVAEAPQPQPVTAIASVRVSARILRPAQIRFGEALPDNSRETVRDEGVQQGRDEAGTVWIEFS